jgi:hypothetical protein
MVRGERGEDGERVVHLRVRRKEDAQLGLRGKCWRGKSGKGVIAGTGKARQSRNVGGVAICPMMTCTIIKILDGIHAIAIAVPLVMIISY